ncbi:MAG TPA: ABC transporter ATP-binding protein [Candidatus Acidoferrales bacterium]|nr:ABC transporter ATP-binding protein [Candidatus Acidoferrales bacterium]
MSTPANNVEQVMAGQALPVPTLRQRMEALRNVPPVLKMIWEAAPRPVFGAVLFRVLVAVVPAGTLLVGKYIIDALTVRYKNQYHTPLPHYFWWLVAAEFALACVAMVLSRLADYCETVTADLFTRYIGKRIMEHASRLDLTSYEDPQIYDKMDRARVQGTDRVAMIRAMGQLIQQVITTVTLAIQVAFYAPWILAILFIAVVPAFVGETHFSFLGYSLNFKQTPARRVMDYLRIVGGSKESIKEVKLFGLGPFFVSRYTTITDELHRETKELARRKLIAGTLLTLLGTLGYYGTYAYVIYETVFGVFTIGTLTLLTGAIAGASTNIQAVFSTFSGIADQALFMTDLLQFFAVRPTVQSKPNALPAPRPIRQGFEFKNVSFSYPGHSRLVLGNVSFRLEPGERLALVGENGQGKTTIVKLLTRLYDVTSGQILLDGIDLREYDLEDLWKEIGVIFQDFMKYEMTATENIGIGRIEDLAREEMIQEAARKSMAEHVIRKLPKGYGQILGSRFEGGADLSGGEWQKIALARAYLRDAQLLILDEPTASLDARSEHEVFERFAELTRGKMSLLISHRFSTVRMADRILVLENGRIVEQGPHDELLKGGGRYAEMFELQASSYR